MWLYHVTARQNIEGIRREGINPAYSTGKRRWSWYVDETRLTWAIAHVSLKHDIPVSKLVVAIVDVPPEFRLRTAWQGVFVAHKTCRPFEIDDVARFLSDVSERDVKV